MREEFKDLADAFYASGERAKQRRYNLPDSSEQIVITVTRTSNQRLKRTLKKLAESQYMSPYGSGARCPTCDGTGRL